MTDAFDAIRACDSFDDVRLAFRDAIAVEGYTASACGAFLPAPDGPAAHFFFLDWPEGWRKLYIERNFAAVDFSVAEARQRISPFTWLEAKATRSMAPAERDLWSTVLAWGWSDGFSVPIHGPAGYFGLVTMAGKFRALSLATRRHLQMLAIAAHDRCRALAGRDPAIGPSEPLTPRELESLRWVAAGLTDPQISAAMDISATTVKSHVDAARRKLTAHTRAHAVARMILLGLG